MSWGCYRVPAAIRAPARDAANRLRSWLLGKLRRYDTELQQMQLELSEAHRSRREWEAHYKTLAIRLEHASSEMARMIRDRDQFEKQVRNRERNVSVKEQQLQGLEQQIQTAYANGVRDGKFERAALQEQAATGDRAAARALHEPITRDDIRKAYDNAICAVRRLEYAKLSQEPLTSGEADRSIAAIKNELVDHHPKPGTYGAAGYQGTPRMPIIKPQTNFEAALSERFQREAMQCFKEPISLQDAPRARPAIEAAKVLTPEEPNAFEKATASIAELDQKRFELEHGETCKLEYGTPAQITLKPKDDKNGRGPTET